MAHLEAVNLGRIRPTEHGTLRRTAIDKRPVAHPVLIHRLGVGDDEIADLTHHGGPDQAVYAFAREDYAYWERELGRALAPGTFGENLTTVGVNIQDARIGERWRVGASLLEVTGVRIPCSVFAGAIGERRWVKRFTRHGVPGAYLRVIEPGEVRSGDPIQVVETRDHHLTVGFAFQAGTTRPELLADLAAEPRLGGGLRRQLEHHVARG